MALYDLSTEDISKSEITRDSRTLCAKPMEEGLITIGVPSGIGDVSWMYSKLMHTGRMNWQIADGHPYRTREFLGSLEMVAGCDYGDFRYDDILIQQNIHKNDKYGVTWEDIEKRCGGFGLLLLEANKHLEAGKRLEDWLPDLPTNFHYPVPSFPDAVEKAEDILAGLKGTVVAVNAASERGAVAWKTWLFPEWKRFLDMLSSTGVTILLVGGFWDDLTADLEQEGKYACVVGKTNQAAILEILRRVDYYIGFSSGLGIMRTVFDKPSFMMWPDFQLPLSTSWAPKDMLEDGRYVASLWRDPEMVFSNVQRWMRR